ncbi:MAG: hypothetical protein ACRCUE_04705 [Bosea sp. (in: a-proteobacteria)]
MTTPTIRPTTRADLPRIHEVRHGTEAERFYLAQGWTRVCTSHSNETVFRKHL